MLLSESIKKEVSFSYKVFVNGVLPKDEAELIFEHLKAHPDTKRYTNQGEFGFSFVNYYKGQDVDREFKFQEIDKMLKALEYPLHLHKRGCSRSLKVKALQRLHIWAGLINKEYNRLNKK